MKFLFRKQNLPVTLCVAGTVVVACVLVWLVFMPAYTQPINRTYTSTFGYAQVMRQMGTPFEVETTNVEIKRLSRPILGEGFMSSQSVLVPVIPTDRIVGVYVEEGQVVEKGQLLADIDTRRAEIKLNSARLALNTAQAELDRVLIGSAYVLAQERPEKDQIQVDATTIDLGILKDKESIYQSLVDEGALPRIKLLDLQRQITEVERTLKEGEFHLGMSTKGQLKSRLIAENAIEDARNSYAQRELEMESYKIYAPTSGIVERVLIQPGEYNQDSGKPAFVIVADSWFEANLDQSALALVSEGDAASVYLEAFPGRPISAVVTKVIPIVTFNLGGPETNRPIRPSGTGAPEWPATFKVRVRFTDADAPSAAPGLTGFARIDVGREGLAVPTASVLSRSAGSGYVFSVGEGDLAEKTLVACGISSNGWTEITDGLVDGQTVIRRGHEALEIGDKLVVVSQ